MGQVTITRIIPVPPPLYIGGVGSFGKALSPVSPVSGCFGNFREILHSARRESYD